MDLIQVCGFVRIDFPGIWMRSPAAIRGFWGCQVPGFHPGYVTAARHAFCRSGFSREALRGLIAAEAAPTKCTQDLCRAGKPANGQGVSTGSPDAIRGLCGCQLPGFHPGYVIAARHAFCRSGFSREALWGLIAAEAAPTTCTQDLCRAGKPANSQGVSMGSQDAIRGFWGCQVPGFHPGDVIAARHAFCGRGFSRDCCGGKRCGWSIAGN